MPLLSNDDEIKLIGRPFIFFGMVSGINSAYYFGVREIDVFADHIEIIWKGIKYSHMWNEILEATVVHEVPSTRGNAFDLYTVTLKTQDNRFRFRLIPRDSCYFMNDSLVLPTLRRHLEFREVEKESPWRKIFFMVAGLVLTGFILLVVYLGLR